MEESRWCSIDIEIKISFKSNHITTAKSDGKGRSMLPTSKANANRWARRTQLRQIYPASLPVYAYAYRDAVLACWGGRWHRRRANAFSPRSPRPVLWLAAQHDRRGSPTIHTLLRIGSFACSIPAFNSNHFSGAAQDLGGLPLSMGTGSEEDQTTVIAT